MAAHLEGKGASVLDFTGFAQKFGPVLSFIRLGPTPEAINQVRIDPGSADAVIACDIVVSSSPKASACYRRGTRVVLNLAEMPTGDVVRHRDADLAVPAREAAIAARRRPPRTSPPSTPTASPKRLLGDSVYANIMMLGFAWQQGLVPVSFDALSAAIDLNGVARERNHAAFACGRLMAARSPTPSPPRSAGAAAAAETARRAHRAPRRLPRRLPGRAPTPTATARASPRLRAAAAARTTADALTATAAQSLFKLMAYKDEYEVARLHARPEFAARLAEAFEGDFRVRYHLAPPFLPAGKDARGRPLKRSFGPWMTPLFRRLAGLRRLRGTWADPFGHTAERREERALIAWYEALLDRCAAAGGAGPWPEILAAPMDIRGYGPVKDAAIARVKAAVAAQIQLTFGLDGKGTHTPGACVVHNVCI